MPQPRFTDQHEIVIVGSQSILGAFPTAPEVLLASMKADFYPLHRPELADLIDGFIGELSPFHETFGYYAQGVGSETAILPAGWERRLVTIQNDNTNLKIGLCLDPHDLAASKLAAGREKDWLFVEAMLKHKLVTADALAERIETLPIRDAVRALLKSWLAQHRLTEPRPGTGGGTATSDVSSSVTPSP